MKIHIDEIDWDEPMMQIVARYQGSKFTGIAFDDYDEYYSEQSFKEGELHGRSYSLNNLTGELRSESFYDNGRATKTHFNW